MRFFNKIRDSYRDLKRLKSDKLVMHNPNSLLSVFQSQKSIFIHIPKTGGVSLVKSLYGKHVEPGGHRRHQYLNKLFPDIDNYFVFTIVRNPWDRLYSAYQFIISGGVNEHDEKAYQNHLKHINSFEEFVMYWLSKKNIRHIIHFYPQIWFLENKNKKINIDYIGRFEELNQSFNFLSNKFEIKTDLEHLNQTKNKESYRAAYSKEMIKKVENVYKLDVEIFNYSF